MIIQLVVAAAVIAFAIKKKTNSTVVEKAEIVEAKIVEAEIVEAEIVAPVKKEITLKPKKQSAEKKAEPKQKKSANKKLDKK